MYKQSWKAPNKEFNALYRDLATKIRDMYNIPDQPLCFTSKLITKSVGRYIVALKPGESILDEAIVFMDELQNTPIKTQQSVIAHELAHFVATHIYRMDCQHDHRWQQIANKISAELNIPITIFTSDEYLKQMLDKQTKYVLVCNKCGTVLKKYKRKPHLSITKWVHSTDRGELRIEKL